MLSHLNAKDIFSQSKNGELKVPKQTIEHHLKTTYSDECCSAPMPDMTEFDIGEPRP